MVCAHGAIRVSNPRCTAPTPGFTFPCGAPATEKIGDLHLCRECFLDEHPDEDVAFNLECHAEVADEHAKEWMLAAARRLRN